MSVFLGIDTSNYTTSAALYDPATDSIRQKKQLLPVASGKCGLRQSDAVFHHTRQLPSLLEELLGETEEEIAAIGVSVRPRDAEGSYMPCFTVGHGTARSLSAALRVPLYPFSHQSGHIAAALFSAGCRDWLGKPFFAFHVSGGTTEAVLVTPEQEAPFSVRLVAGTLDLHAGQLIDRIGVMLGLDFPCGPALEKLAAANTEPLRARATLKGCDCCLSGVENACRRYYEHGGSREATAALCFLYIEKTLMAMGEALTAEYGEKPVLFAGGVMSNRLMRTSLSGRFDARFAEPAFSADNAAGTAYLSAAVHNHHQNQ